MKFEKYFWGLTTIFLINVLFLNIEAKEVKNLSLDEAIEIAMDNNFEILSAKAELEMIKGDVSKANATFLPQLTISEMYAKTNNPLNAFGFKLKQKSVTAGDFFDMSQMSMGNFDTTPLNEPEAVENFTSKIEFKQPLINFDGFSGKSAAHNGVKAMQFKQKRVENFVIFMIKRVYFGLILSRKSLAVIDNAIEAAVQNRNMAKSYFEEGYINQSDLLLAEVYVLKMESRKTEIENQIVDANNNLKYMLGINSNTEIIPTDKLSPVKYAIPEFDIDKISNSRSDMLAMKYGVKSLEKMVNMNYFKFLPRLNAFGSYEFNDTNLLGKDADSWMIGVMTSWDIFKGFSQIGEIKKSKAKLRQAKVNLNKEISKSFIEIESAISAMKTAEKLIELSNQSTAQTQERYRIVSDRYSQGLEKTSDLLIAEAELSNSRLQGLKAMYDFNINAFKIEFLLEQNITN